MEIDFADGVILLNLMLAGGILMYFNNPDAMHSFLLGAILYQVVKLRYAQSR